MESFFKSGQRIFVHGGASTPNALLEKLKPIFYNLEDIEMIHLRFLSEILSLFRKGILPIDIALIQVSPPDEKGWCS